MHATEPEPLDERRPEVTPDELLSSAIPLVKRGYDPDVIDTLLERAAATIARLRALDAPELERQRRGQAEVLQRTLMMAQTTADHTVAEAQSRAASLVRDAERHSQQVLADAEHLSAHLVESETARAQATVAEALARREVLEDDIRALQAFAAESRARLRDAFYAETAALDARLAEAVPEPPARHQIDLTDPRLDAPALDEASLSWIDEPAPLTARLV